MCQNYTLIKNSKKISKQQQHSSNRNKKKQKQNKKKKKKKGEKERETMGSPGGETKPGRGKNEINKAEIKKRQKILSKI